MQRVLVTGGGGMVGRNLLEAFRTRADLVVSAPDRGTLDLKDSVATRAFFEQFAPDIIIHAAGRVGGIQANVADPVAFLVENLDIGRNVVLAARDLGVPRLLNLGSSCIYPRDRTVPLREEDVLTGELEPTNEGYALAKIVTLRLCQYVSHREPRLEYKTIIPCNLYGRYDHFDPAVSHLVPAVIRKIHEAKAHQHSTVEIWGDGSARREFMFSGDLAQLVTRALDQFETLPEIMNVGVGGDHSVLDYYTQAAAVIGWEGEFVFNKGKPVGMQRKLVDVTRQSAWGWSPPTGLRDGLAATYAYFREIVQL